VKVQRPDVAEQVTLDLYVIRQGAKLGAIVPNEIIARQSKNLIELLDLTSPPFMEELDYESEAANQRRFAETVEGCDLIRDTVVVPEVVLSCPEVLVQEWIDGRKLTEPGVAQENSGKVVNLLINSYMVQFLETGYLHGDPHPGNFVLTPSGKLGILDYGLMTSIAPDKRVAFIEYLMHLQAKEYDKCLEDLINLEFVPKEFGSDPEARKVLVPALARTLSTLYSEGGDMKKQRERMMKQSEEMKASGKLELLRDQLRALSKKYGSFRLPSYFTLILRAFTTLEGLGLRQNENFSVVKECFPYIARRLLTDDSLRIRDALKSYLYKGRSRIAVSRVDDLASGFGTFTNLMKGDREEYISGDKTVAPSPAAQRSADGARQVETAPKLELDPAATDIASVVFSPEGNFLQDLLIDEGVAAIDALSRAALLQLLRTLGPFALPLTLPLQLVLGVDGNGARIVSRDDKEALLLLRRIVRLIQAPSARDDERQVGFNTTNITNAAQDLRRLQPLAQGILPTVGPGAAAFSQRFGQQLARRVLLRLAEDIERNAGLGEATLVSS